MITLYGISNCDTIRKTRKFLDDRALRYRFHDYKKQGCTSELVGNFLEHFTYRELINTRGTTWRKLPDSIKNTLDRDRAIKLMTEQSSIIKRPLIATDSEWVLGFDTAQLERLK